MRQYLLGGQYSRVWPTTTSVRAELPNTLTSNDVMFQSMMLSGVLDLTVMELWICQSGKTCDLM